MVTSVKSMGGKAIVGIVGAFLFLGSAVAYAADESHGEGGLPQLDASTYPSQIFWLLVAFVVLYLLMSRTALPRITDILEERSERISSDLDKAAALKTEAEEVQKAYEASLASAQSDARDLLAKTKGEIEADAAQRQAALTDEIDQRATEAEQRIAQARDAAMADVRTIAVDIAGTVVAKISDQPADTGAMASAVDAAMEGRS